MKKLFALIAIIGLGAAVGCGDGKSTTSAKAGGAGGGGTSSTTTK